MKITLRKSVFSGSIFPFSSTVSSKWGESSPTINNVWHLLEMKKSQSFLYFPYADVFFSSIKLWLVKVLELYFWHSIFTKFNLEPKQLVYYSLHGMTKMHTPLIHKYILHCNLRQSFGSNSSHWIQFSFDAQRGSPRKNKSWKNSISSFCKWMPHAPPPWFWFAHGLLCLESFCSYM